MAGRNRQRKSSFLSVFNIFKSSNKQRGGSSYSTYSEEGPKVSGTKVWPSDEDKAAPTPPTTINVTSEKLSPNSIANPTRPTKINVTTPSLSPNFLATPPLLPNDQPPRQKLHVEMEKHLETLSHSPIQHAPLIISPNNINPTYPPLPSHVDINLEPLSHSPIQHAPLILSPNNVNPTNPPLPSHVDINLEPLPHSTLRTLLLPSP
ncbi:hypothetical protein ACSQ67_002024 [Phaseolus vulgaris]